MILEVTARHGDLSDDLREHAEEKVHDALKHAERIVSAHVVLDVEKERQMAEIIVYGRNLTATVHAESQDPWISVDRAAEKLKHQLQRHHSKKISRRRRGLTHEHAAQAELEAMAQAAEQEEDGAPAPPPMPVTRSTVSPVSLSLTAACASFEVSEDEVMLFRDSGSGRLAVLYRDPEGELAMLETEAT